MFMCSALEPPELWFSFELSCMSSGFPTCRNKNQNSWEQRDKNLWDQTISCRYKITTCTNILCWHDKNKQNKNNKGTVKVRLFFLMKGRVTRPLMWNIYRKLQQSPDTSRNAENERVNDNRRTWRKTWVCSVPGSETCGVLGSSGGWFWGSRGESRRRRATPVLQWTRRMGRRTLKTEMDSQTALWGQRTRSGHRKQHVWWWRFHFFTRLLNVELSEWSSVCDGPTCCPQRACWIYLSSPWYMNAWESPWERETITSLLIST